MALNVDPKSLIIESNYHGLVYRDPIEKAQELSAFLKNKKSVILWFVFRIWDRTLHPVDVNDFTVAHQTNHIDIILGGHSHSLLENGKTNNANGKR